MRDRRRELAHRVVSVKIVVVVLAGALHMRLEHEKQTIQIEIDCDNWWWQQSKKSNASLAIR